MSVVDTLRDYQLDALTDLRNNIKAGVRRQVLQMPTGSGKTKVAAALAELSSGKGNRVCFLADRIELIDQASMRFDAEKIQHGVTQGNHWRFQPQHRVQIATIQTLINRTFDPFDLIVVDECHAGGKRLNNWVCAQDSVVIGLSATPWATGMGRTWQKLVVSVTTKELIERGLLVDVVAWAPFMPDLSKVKVVAGEYEDKSLALACDQPRLVADIVATWVEKGENRQTIAFAVDVAHSQHIVEQFRSAGVEAAHVDGYENPAERKKTIDAFRRGEIKLISNVGILDKGFDVPEASCLVMARPIRSSLMLHIQQIGRVLRASPGKQNAIILDHAGNLNQHGFPTDPLPEELDMGLPKKKSPAQSERKPKVCPSCKLVKPAGVHACPNCGFAPARPNEVFHEDGELVEVKRTEDKRLLWAEIKCMQGWLRRSDGWAAHTYRSIVGIWPRGMDGIAPAETASQWLQNHVRARDIAFFRSLKNGGGGDARPAA